jgi:hypothetical protein
MKRFAIVVAILCGLCFRTCFARVGEFWEDVEKRYGHQTFTGLKDPFGNHQFVYEFKDFQIVVTYIDKISVCEEFTKKVKGDDISKEEVETVLAANAPAGATWKRDSALGWASSDGKLKAIHALNTLQIATNDYTEKVAAYNKAKRENKLKGF